MWVGLGGWNGTECTRPHAASESSRGQVLNLSMEILELAGAASVTVGVRDDTGIWRASGTKRTPTEDRRWSAGRPRRSIRRHSAGHGFPLTGPGVPRPEQLTSNDIPSDLGPRQASWDTNADGGYHVRSGRRRPVTRDAFRNGRAGARRRNGCVPRPPDGRAPRSRCCDLIPSAPGVLWSHTPRIKNILLTGEGGRDVGLLDVPGLLVDVDLDRDVTGPRTHGLCRNPQRLIQTACCIQRLDAAPSVPPSRKVSVIHAYIAVADTRPLSLREEVAVEVLQAGVAGDGRHDVLGAAVGCDLDGSRHV